MTSRASSPITMRLATPDDAALLASFGAATFSATFAQENTPAHMADYLATSFGEAVQRAELADARHVVWLAESDGETVGYVMLRLGPAPDSVRDSDAIEIARLYAAPHKIGAGIGAALMQRSLREAAARGKHTIWLGVWERNARAIAFYRRWGFTETGTQTFKLGSDVQTDYVMARRVELEAGQ
jgi:ribosomal protein S18 acetylase RimI-like enzyme